MAATTLDELINGLPIDLVHGDRAVKVTGITEDSRVVSPGDLFIARPGLQTDGARFIADAVERGARVVLAEQDVKVPSGVVHLAADSIPRLAAELAERFFDHPSREFALIGVTGTNGKTTVAYLIHQILTTAGTPCGFIGTIGIDRGDALEPAAYTTPPAVEISRLLREMVDRGLRACAMEVSSHSIVQQRVAALRFAGAVFTNLSGDHLDYHGSMDTYTAAKARLFEQLDENAFAVVNQDDELAPRMIERCRARIVRTGLAHTSADYFASIETMRADSTTCTMQSRIESNEVTLKLVGQHNVSNALQALAAGEALGLDRNELIEAIAVAHAPPGRLEPVTKPTDEFAVLVDYAHTDDALRNVLSALRPLVEPPRRLIVVFGCGGDRDRTKRPRMSQAAWAFGDEVIVTSDNPRTEDPQRIVDDIREGIPRSKLDQTTFLVDRAEAIHCAIQLARPGDLVLIAGKGHEEYQIIGTTKRPFDDRLVAAAALAGRQREVALV